MDSNDLNGIPCGLHHHQGISLDHQSIEGDSPEGGSENSHPPPTFPRLIEFFEQAEQDHDVSLPLKNWHARLRGAIEGAGSADAFQAIVSLLHGMETTWPDFDHRIPTEILLEGSRYGKPIA